MNKSNKPISDNNPLSGDEPNPLGYNIHGDEPKPLSFSSLSAIRARVDPDEGDLYKNDLIILDWCRSLLQHIDYLNNELENAKEEIAGLKNVDPVPVIDAFEPWYK